MIVEGQVHGGIAQGVGQALLEEVVYDESGQQLSASYMDYTMPRADDVPSYDVLHHNTKCTTNPLGHQGLRRSRGHRVAAGGDQRDHERHRQQRPVHAGHAVQGLGGDQLGQDGR